jgi:hypothetical protein
MKTLEQIRTLVAVQLQQISQPECRLSLERFLVEPRLHQRNWDYGKEGESYPCWMVAEFPGTDTGIVFSEHGFGPSYPWGLVLVSEPWFGMDPGLFASLEDAFRNSGGWDGENPPGYEVQ